MNILKRLFDRRNFKSENRKLRKQIKFAIADIDEVLEELKDPPNHEDEKRQKISVFYRHVQIQNLERIRNKLK